MYSDLDIKFDNYKDKYIKITISKNVNIITPGLDKIIGKDYKIEIERVVPNA